MANLPSDSLPSQFDVIVCGTGLVESIVASALARCGKSVLHLDRNGFYGDLGASLMHREFNDLFLTSSSFKSEAPQLPFTADDRSINIQTPSNPVTNVVETIHGCKKTSPTTKEDLSREMNLDSQEVEDPSSVNKDDKLLLSWDSLDKLKRRLVYDISPKVLACRGEMVDLLTKSGCSRYVEFKAISKICFFQSGTPVQVPCSRADIFESKLVSMLEKRKMMKFLSSLSNLTDSDIEGLEDVTMIEYLRHSDLTENLIQYVLLCISMTEENTSVQEGLKAAKLFLNSLGRFENAPFLFPIFGNGELSQAFCRLCAVFGGVYCLKRWISSLGLSKLNEVSDIVCSNGQRIACSALVCNASFMKETFDVKPNVKMSRAIILVDKPIVNTDGKLALLTLPPFSSGSDQSHTIRLLQLDPSTNTAVDGTYMIHLFCPSVNSDANQDLEGAVRLICNTQDESSCNHSGPRVLWSVYFNLVMCAINQEEERDNNIPGNVYLTSDPGYTITYEDAVREAKSVFSRLYPDEGFLEPPPEPEEVVLE